jgi:Phosphotransferase enzyme family
MHSLSKPEKRKEDIVDPAELLQHINVLHQTTFAFIEKYPDGEQGAFVVTDHQNRRWVLKWAPGAHNLQWMQGAKTVTDLLRSLSYPAPYYLLIGKIPEGIYSIQSVLPGSPMRRLAPTLLPRLFELNELQLGQAIPGRKDWHQEVINTVLLGGDGYCLHSSLQQHSRGTSDLLQTLQTLVMAHQDEPHRTNDIVHGDFQHSNILIHDEQISGIVDWDGSFAGDCTFDITTLLFYSYDFFEVRERLWDYALERASLKLLSIYLAHLILRQVDWSLRYHDQTTSERYITRGQMLLQEIAHRSHSAR